MVSYAPVPSRKWLESAASVGVVELYSRHRRRRLRARSTSAQGSSIVRIAPKIESRIRTRSRGACRAGGATGGPNDLGSGKRISIAENACQLMRRFR